MLNWGSNGLMLNWSQHAYLMQLKVAPLLYFGFIVWRKNPCLCRNLWCAGWFFKTHSMVLP